ncbi:NUDIX domain-containing protein [Saccharopolyspora sp. HNM0983]|uniref:NUDIX domain-containing protein n=1 Tax=Saccharopolyspora montiporae TaxID=2781240 RepID=A0A929BBS1_9PSEU|nr:NUDIX domain-containing protein [Saccharopolyspora sp. HNM0983]MBE9375855.1 NUDIX domain-containing protein [Saccharopolyspora sp. HNM0983]
MSQHSAGILLFRLRGGALQVLVVHPGGPFWRNKDAGAWSLPKGEHDPDEDARAAALREFTEETGADLGDPALLDLGRSTLRSGKVVTAFAVEGEFDEQELRSNEFEVTWPPKSGRAQRFPEVDRALWCDPDTARTKLNPAQAVFVDRLQQHLAADGRGGS